MAEPRPLTTNAKARLLNQAEEYFIANPYAPNTDCMKAIGCSLRTATQGRKRGVKKGLIPPSYYDRTTEIEPLTTEGAEKLQEELAKMRGEGGDPLTTEEKLNLLSKFARHASLEGDTKRATDAIMAHTNLEARTTKLSLGPPPPLTRDDKVRWMKLVVDVVGPSILAESIIGTLDLTVFEEELGRLKATHPLLPQVRATFQAAYSPPRDGALEQDEPTP